MGSIWRVGGVESGSDGPPPLRGCKIMPQCGLDRGGLGHNLAWRDFALTRGGRPGAGWMAYKLLKYMEKIMPHFVESL